MKLKLTLQRADSATDLLVTCDAATTVGDLADYLRASDPLRRPNESGERWTLSLVGVRNHFSTRTPLAESGLRSGATVTLVPAGAGSSAVTQDRVATAKVLSGPDTGREFPLTSGSNLIGRDNDCSVRLTDPLVSRKHARLNVTDGVEIIDLGSANGVLIDGAQVERSALPADQTAQLGNTVIAVQLHRRASIEVRMEGSAVGFIRSPRVVKPFTGEEFEAPELPTPPGLQRFPLLTMIAPVLLGVGLYLLTRQLASLLFIALSPLMLIGSYLEQRWSGRATTKRQRKTFLADLADLVLEIEAAAAREVDSRLIEHPSAQECYNATQQQSNLLWTRRQDSPGLAEFRLGLGELASRSTITLPAGRRGPRDLYAELVRQTSPLRTVRGVPVVAAPLTEGALGIAGARSAAIASAWAVVTQAAALHSPNEMVIAALASNKTAENWEWLKWLPHCGSPASPLTTYPLVSTPAEAAKLIGELEALIAERAEADPSEQPAALPIVLVVVESDAPAEFGRLVTVAEEGWKQGIIVVWLAPETSMLPAACRVFLELATTTGGRVGYLHTGDQVLPVTPDTVMAEAVWDLGRRLAPVIDLAARTDDASDLPRSVSLLSLTGMALGASPRAVIEKWAESQSIAADPPYARPTGASGNLRAVIGMAAGDPHAIDLRSQGPHALVGGTTGSGKSELLQTWILAMALNHSPQRLTFLLVDYKGGAAFEACKDLPHTVGLVTDLKPKGVRRALESLRAELRFREHVLNSHRVKDLVELEKLLVPDIPPSLVIIVDEFAALLSDVPEFIDGMIDVAQRGRSLGLHLILATQQPGGVIKGNLRANTNLRLALRVADVDDSQDVIGSPQAAYFDQHTPGRAVSKTGPGRLVPFQAAYVGGHTDESATKHDIAVEELAFGTPRRWEPRVLGTPHGSIGKGGDPGPTDMIRIVTTLNAAATEAALRRPREPWKAELATHYNLIDRALVPNRRTDHRLVFGLKDEPRSQRQVAAAFEPDVSGNLAVFGTGGAGKSTLLRSLAVTASFTIRGGRSHVYGIDFGSRGLDLIQNLPHVGAIIAGSDDERVRRLLSMLANLVEERAARYAGAKVDSITAYRQVTGQSDEPRILLFIDGIAAFRQVYETPSLMAWWDRLIKIAQGGRAVGVHLVVTADRAGALPSALASTMQQRIVLRMADPTDYDLLGVPKDTLNEKSPPGRGIDRDLELQVAVLGDSADAAAQAKALDELGRVMLEKGSRPAPTIERLPEVIPEAQLPASTTDGGPCLGVRSSTLLPFTIATTGTFLVTGPPGAGRTTTLAAIAHALRRWQPSRQLVLLAHQRSALAVEEVWDRVALGGDQVLATTTELVEQLHNRSGRENAQLSVIIDGLLDLSSMDLDQAFTDLSKACDATGAQLVWDADATAIAAGPYGLMGQLRMSRSGLALQPDPGDGQLAFKTMFPTKLDSADFPPGRGLLVGKGRTDVVQVMLPS